MDSITKNQYEFALDCLERMYRVYLKYHLLYDKEVQAREALERELKELKKRN
jgi:hypothetical protein